MNTVPCRHGNFELLSGDSIVSESLLWYGEWAENELDLLRRFVAPGSVVADVGSFIGTHAVALAHAVGGMGQVHAFEPRRETFEILKRNIDNNVAGRVTAHNVGVSDHPATIHLMTQDPQTRNLGGLSLIDQGEGYEVEVITLDMLALPRLDLMKVDVEGMEASVIAGARETLARCRPVVFAECNTVTGAAATLEAIRGLDYVAYGTIYPAFNENNFKRATVNFYGESAECAIFLVPEEKCTPRLLEGMRPINDLEDVVALLLEKPQYLPEILPAAPSTPPLRRQQSSRQVASGIRRHPLHIVVPFFRNPQLVTTFMAGLRAAEPELAGLDVQVWLYNDSPDDADLASALASAGSAGVGPLPLRIVDNPSNLGFIGTCNQAFARAVEEGADVFVLNSDTQLTPGALSEVLSVAAIDPMFAFISPRSNNATLASLPHSPGADADVDTALGRFRNIAPRLPRYSLVPTAAGFAMWIRGSVLAEFGGFDPAYGQGYNEENDLVMRANRAGYRAVLANHAFVWHAGEQSFAMTGQQRSEREERNGVLLRERYPEYEPLLQRYHASPEYRAEALLEALHPDSGRRLIAFDFSSFGAAHNGTFESGVKLLAAAVSSWPADIDLAVIIGPDAWHFHGLDQLPRVRRIAPEDRQARAAAVIRMGQPFDDGTLYRLFNVAPVVGIFMLDTIAVDCGRLSLEFDDRVWRQALLNTSILFCNSEFTLTQIRNRYPLGEHVLPVVSRHSLDVTEYLLEADAETNAEGVSRHILIIGNRYPHKFVTETADALAAALPGQKIVAVGYALDAPHAPNIEAVQAGGIDENTFAAFYRDAKVVVFPSHYEGFGFPVLHSLAWKRPIFVRDSLLNNELASHIRESANIHSYQTTRELVAALAQPPSWSPEERAGERNGWERSAGEVFSALSRAMQGIRSDQVASALRDLRVSERSSGERLAEPIADLLDKALSIPLVRKTQRFVRRHIP